MKNKITIVVIVLLVINIIMTGFLIAKVIAGDKEIEKLGESVDESFEDVSEDIDEVEASVRDAKSAIGEIMLELESEDSYSDSGHIQADNDIEVEIWIDEDYNIYRTGVDNNVSSLTWDIIYNGELVLSRNALDETIYKYFRSDPGTYTIYVTSYIDGSYKIVSNVISYTIE